MTISKYVKTLCVISAATMMSACATFSTESNAKADNAEVWAQALSFTGAAERGVADPAEHALRDEIARRAVNDKAPIEVPSPAAVEPTPVVSKVADYNADNVKGTPSYILDYEKAQRNEILAAQVNEIIAQREERIEVKSNAKVSEVAEVTEAETVTQTAQETLLLAQLQKLQAERQALLDKIAELEGQISAYASAESAEAIDVVAEVSPELSADVAMDNKSETDDLISGEVEAVVDAESEPEYTWVEKEVVVVPERWEEKVSPAVFEWAEVPIEISPAYSTYITDADTGEIKEKLVEAKIITIKKQVLRRAAEVQRIHVPAVTKVIKEKHIVQPPQRNSAPVEQSVAVAAVEESKWYTAPTTESYVFELSASAALLSGVVNTNGVPNATAELVYHTTVEGIETDEFAAAEFIE